MDSLRQNENMKTGNEYIFFILIAIKFWWEEANNKIKIECNIISLFSYFSLFRHNIWTTSLFIFAHIDHMLIVDWDSKYIEFVFLVIRYSIITSYARYLPPNNNRIRSNYFLIVNPRSSVRTSFYRVVKFNFTTVNEFDDTPPFA